MYCVNGEISRIYGIGTAVSHVDLAFVPTTCPEFRVWDAVSRISVWDAKVQNLAFC